MVRVGAVFIIFCLDCGKMHMGSCIFHHLPRPLGEAHIVLVTYHHFCLDHRECAWICRFHNLLPRPWKSAHVFVPFSSFSSTAGRNTHRCWWLIIIFAWTSENGAWIFAVFKIFDFGAKNGSRQITENKSNSVCSREEGRPTCGGV